ncbi:response regulator [Cecembia lonarensis]|uniref:Sensory/regulatory protein RpfC n=1 Tax=Cecembia lonarensis (strain CCUG 58316 / KCTC 22772 / LW9) TaxID=1225176 RepID=K1L8R1_CECL9|nr:response regulator [Cecembia lonarensis]EKB48582.1 Sensory/regulatory protein RpfC [Cecembia lonarensis LW9]
MKVLVVDDDAINRLILKKIFEKENDTVLTANDGEEALQILISEPDFNVVITDIMMPKMDGIQLLAEIKLKDEINKIPIIGFTAGDIEYFKSTSLVSFDRLLAKPMDFYELYGIAKAFGMGGSNVN